jgi:hypothetical protein
VGTSRVAGCLYRCHTALKSKTEKITVSKDKIRRLMGFLIPTTWDWLSDPTRIWIQWNYNCMMWVCPTMWINSLPWSKQRTWWSTDQQWSSGTPLADKLTVYIDVRLCSFQWESRSLGSLVLGVELNWWPFVVADHWMAARTIQVVSTYGLVANPGILRSLRHVHPRKLRCSQTCGVEVPQTFCREAWIFSGIQYTS